MVADTVRLVGRNADLERIWRRWLGDHGRTTPHVVLISGPAGSGRRALATRIARDLDPLWDTNDKLDARKAKSDAVLAHYRKEVGWIRAQRLIAFTQNIAGMTGLAPAVPLGDVLGKVVELSAQFSERRGDDARVPVGVLIDWDHDPEGAERLSNWLRLHALGRYPFWLVVVVSADLDGSSAFDNILKETLDPTIPTSPSLCLRTSPWWDRAAVVAYAEERLRSQRISGRVLAALWAGAAGPEDPPGMRALGRVTVLLDRWVVRGAVAEDRGRWQLARKTGVSGWFGARLPSPSWDELVEDLAGSVAEEEALVLAAWGAASGEGVERTRRVSVPVGALEEAVGADAVARMLIRGTQPRDSGPPLWYVAAGELVWADPLLAAALAERAHGEASIRGAASRQAADAVQWVAERPWSERQHWSAAETSWRAHANLQLEGIPDLGDGEHDDVLAYIDWLRWEGRPNKAGFARIVERLEVQLARQGAFGVLEQLYLLAMERDCPLGDREQGVVLCCLGLSVLGQGRFVEAEVLLQQALEDAIQGGAERWWVGAARQTLSCAVLRQGRFADAEVLLRQALVEMYQGGAERWWEGAAGAALGCAVLEQGRHAEAEALLRHAREKLEGTIQGGADCSWVGVLQLALGRTVLEQGRHAEAEALLRPALEYPIQGWAERWLVGAVCFTLGQAVLEQGRLAEAEVLMRQAHQDALQGGADLLLLGKIRYGLGQASLRQGRVAEAEALMRQAHEDALQGGADLLLLGKIRYGLGGAVLDQGRLAEAEVLLLQALEDLLKSGGDRKSVGGARHQLGCAALRQGQDAEAEVWFRQALEDALLSGVERRSVGETRGAIGRAVLNQGRFAEAAALLRAALEDKLAGGGDRRSVGVSRVELGRAALKQGQAGEAEAWFRQALEDFLEGGGDFRSVGAIRVELGRAVLEQGRLAEAEAVSRQALEDALQGRADRRAVGITRHQLGCVVREQGRSAEAEVLLRQALEDALRGEAERWWVGVAHHDLGRAVLHQGRVTEAEALFRQALEDKLQGGGSSPTTAITRTWLAQTLHLLIQLDAARSEAQAAQPDLVHRWVEIAGWSPCHQKLNCAFELRILAEILDDPEGVSRWQAEVDGLTQALS